MPSQIAIAPGVFLWREYLAPPAQQALLDDVQSRLKDAPLYRPVMPGTGKAFSVEESNFGRLGWVSDKSGYRYQPTHPVTGKPWPEIPPALLTLWNAVADFAAPPDCCLLNLYRAGARMGLHQDRDEKMLEAPVISVSLGDEALFRIGGKFENGKWVRGGKTQSLKLASGDVLRFGGVARLAYHGIDRVTAGSSRLIPDGGRLSFTLRKVQA